MSDQKTPATGINPGLSQKDNIIISVNKTDTSNGTYMSSIENMIELMIKYPNAIIKVDVKHATSVFNIIQNIKGTKKYPSISTILRTQAINTFKRSNPVINTVVPPAAAPQTPVTPPQAPAQGSQTVVTPAPAATPVAPKTVVTPVTATVPPAAPQTPTTTTPVAANTENKS